MGRERASREGSGLSSAQRTSAQPSWALLERHPGCALAQAVCDDPRDRAAWAVLADYLTEQGSRLGERISLELGRDACAPAERKTWARRVREFDRRHRHEWMDPGLAGILDRRGKAPGGVNLDWRFGFILGVRLEGGMTHARPGFDVALAAMLDSPLARFMSRVSVDYGVRPLVERAGVRAAIRAARPRPALREVLYRDPLGEARIDELLAWAPALAHLDVGTQPRIGAVCHEQLRSLSLVIRERAPQLSATRPLELPSLRYLAIASRAPAQDPGALADAVLAMLEGAAVPSLDHLYLEGLPEPERPSDVITGLLSPLERAGILARMRVIEFRGFGDEVRWFIRAAHEGALDRLERLVAPQAVLTPGDLHRFAELPFELVLEPRR